MRSDLRVELPDGTMVGYAESGDPAGPPVMYLHGSPSSRLEVGLPGIREAAEAIGLRVLAPDRPGMGLSTFRRYSIADYPRLVRSFADALGLGRFAVTGVSGGGKYACACAWVLPDRVTRVALVSSTCSFDLPGARATWNAEDRRLYRIANGAPWLVRLYLAKVARDLRRDRDALFSTVERSVGAADREVLAHAGFREALDRNMAEAFRQGGRGPAHDLTLEARPWGVPLERIEVPIDIWHGQDDRVVSSEQSRILARTLPLVTEHLVPGEGHFSLFARHAEEVMQSLHFVSSASPVVALDAVVIPPQSPPSGMISSRHGQGPEVLGRLPLSKGRAAELEERPGFVAGRYCDFSGSAGFLLSWAVQYATTDDATRAVSVLLDELQSDDGYGWGMGEEAGLGDEGTCLEGDNPQAGGLHETICVWRNGPLVLVVGGDTGETPLRSVAEAMDARADAVMR